MKESDIKQGLQPDMRNLIYLKELEEIVRQVDVEMCMSPGMREYPSETFMNIRAEILFDLMIKLIMGKYMLVEILIMTGVFPGVPTEMKHLREMAAEAKNQAKIIYEMG